MEYCICGSIKTGGSCTNKKCQQHIKGTEFATYKQISYIQGMLTQLADTTEYELKTMTQKEASKLIDELEERIELGE